MEYVVKVGEGENERYLDVSGNPAFVQLAFASVFKSRERAQKYADRYHAKVELFLGRPQPNGTKFFTTPKQSPINRRSAYRSV